MRYSAGMKWNMWPVKKGSNRSENLVAMAHNATPETEHAVIHALLAESIQEMSDKAKIEWAQKMKEGPHEGVVQSLERIQADPSSKLRPEIIAQMIQILKS